MNYKGDELFAVKELIKFKGKTVAADIINIKTNKRIERKNK